MNRIFNGRSSKCDCRPDDNKEQNRHSKPHGKSCCQGRSGEQTYRTTGVAPTCPCRRLAREKVGEPQHRNQQQCQRPSGPIMIHLTDGHAHHQCPSNEKQSNGNQVRSCPDNHHEAGGQGTTHWTANPEPQ